MVLRRLAALLLAAGSFGAVAVAPAVAIRMIPPAACITPTPILYEKHINAAGTIEAKNIKEIYLDTPVIARAVNVSVGDIVQKDQILAVIDTELTKSVLEQSIPAAGLLDSLPSAKEASDLLGLYSALESTGLTTQIPGMDDLAAVFGSVSERIGEPNGYLYIPETVSAPMDGVVTEVSLKSDVLSRTAKPVVTILDAGSFIAKVSVGEGSVADIHVGDAALVEGAGLPHSYQGHVSRIYPTARKNTGGSVQETVVDLEITIDDPDEALKAGFTARAEITTGQQREMLVVPYEAVRQDENNREYVWLLQDSRAVRRDIKTGMELMEGVEVCEGLTAQDVILQNASEAADGGRIRLKKG